MNPGKTNPEKTIVKDPVCNMDVDPTTARGSAEYKGHTYYFCSPGCVTRFNADPEKYLWRPGRPPRNFPKARWCKSAELFRQNPPNSPQRNSKPPARELSLTSAPWTRKSARASLAHAQNAAWPLSLRPSNTPAPCTRRSCATIRAPARFAAWHWSRVFPPAVRKRTI